MTTPASPNSISFTQIVNEFGSLKTNSSQTYPDLGAYRVYQNVDGISYRLDEGVPFIGQISFDDLRNKSLNVVVDVDGGTRVWGRDPWNNNDVTVIGGGTGKKEGGSRIIIHVKGTVQSEQGTTGQPGSTGNRWSAALRTGTWSSIVSLDVIVGPGSNDGHIRGGGGNGGNGGTSDGEKSESEQEKADGEDGYHGTSGLGLNHNVRNLVVNNGSTIYAGGGGGGGGGGAMGEGAESNEKAGGGGGGGGMGTPSGEGGSAGSNNGGSERTPGAGEDGTATSGGEGGRGGINNEGGGEDSADGGGGGGGGGINKGEGGPAEEGAENGDDGDDMDNNNPGESERGKGGAGGDGDAEGTGQQTGNGGAQGQHGGAIVMGSYNIESITGKNRIYGLHTSSNAPT